MGLTVLSVAYPFAPVTADPAGGAEQVLAQVRDAVDAALALATWQLPVSGVEALVEGLAVESARLGAARMRVPAEAQERQIAGDIGVSTAGWYAQVTNCRGREAVPAVALATALGEGLAPTGRALAAGALSLAHAEVIHRVMTKLAAVLAPSLADRDGDPVLGLQPVEGLDGERVGKTHVRAPVGITDPKQRRRERDPGDPFQAPHTRDACQCDATCDEEGHRPRR